MKINKYIVAVVLYFLGFIIFDSAPKGIYNHHVYLRVFFYLCQYGIIFTLALWIFKQLINPISKIALFSLMIFSAGMFIFHALLINKNLPTYIDWCDSEKAATYIDFGLIGLIIIAGLFIFKKWGDE
jgi:di/tricarboxylate transporter